MTTIGGSRAYQVLSGFIYSYERGRVLQAAEPGLKTLFLNQAHPVMDRLMDLADRLELQGDDAGQLRLQLLHKCRLYFHTENQPPTYLGSGETEDVIGALQTGLEGGEGEIQGQCFGRPVRHVISLEEASWNVFGTTDLPRVLFLKDPEGWHEAENPKYWRRVTILPDRLEEWRCRLSEALHEPADRIRNLIARLKGLPAELRREVAEGLRVAGLNFNSLLHGGLDLFQSLETGVPWDYEAQFLRAEDFAI